MSPIAERTGRRVKILVNHLNEDAAHLVVTEGILELREELERWSNTPIEVLDKLPERVFRALRMADFNTISDLLLASESRLHEVPGISYRDIERVDLALERLGCVH